MIHSLTGRCVVFDLDDTLYEEHAYVVSGYEAVSAAVRARYDTDCSAILSSRSADRSYEGAFQDIIAHFGLPDDAAGFMMKTYRDHLPTLEIEPFVLGGLEALKRQDGVVGCITDGRSFGQRAKIDALGLAAILDPVLISGETGHAKPELFNFEEMMRRVDARDFWYVADNVAKDFVAPNRLGWTTVGVRRTRSVQIGATETSPDHAPAQWKTLPAVFEDLLEGVRA